MTSGSDKGRHIGNMNSYFDLSIVQLLDVKGIVQIFSRGWIDGEDSLLPNDVPCTFLGLVSIPWWYCPGANRLHFAQHLRRLSKRWEKTLRGPPDFPSIVPESDLQWRRLFRDAVHCHKGASCDLLSKIGKCIRPGRDHCWLIRHCYPFEIVVLLCLSIETAGVFCCLD